MTNVRRIIPKVVDTLALLTLARRIGVRRGGRLLAFATTAYLDQQAIGRHKQNRHGRRGRAH